MNKRSQILCHVRHGTVAHARHQRGSRVVTPAVTERLVERKVCPGRLNPILGETRSLVRAHR